LTRNNSGGGVGGGDHQSWVSVARLVIGRKEGEELRLCLDQRVRLAWEPALHSMLLAAGADAASLLAALLPPRTSAASGGGGGHTLMITHINVSEKVSLLISPGQFFSSIKGTVSRDRLKKLEWIGFLLVLHEE
jgi:hypothetical protein